MPRQPHQLVHSCTCFIEDAASTGVATVPAAYNRRFRSSCASRPSLLLDGLVLVQVIDTLKEVEELEQHYVDAQAQFDCDTRDGMLAACHEALQLLLGLPS